MEMLCRFQETRTCYQKLNASRNGFVPRAEICRDKNGGLLTDRREVIERWKQHFDQHQNGVENVGTGAHGNRGNDDANAAEDGNEPTPILREVQEAIHQLKTNKAAGKDDIAAELINMGPEKLATCLHRLIVRIWETEQLPEEWKEGVICPIHKKGDYLECENFRAIIILNAAYKVLSHIIFRHLSPKMNEFVGSYQAGFIDGRLTMDQIFTVRQILQKCREYQVPTHHLLIDFKAAYDSIDRTELWRIMDENGFPGKLTRLIKATMDGVQNCVRVSGQLSSSFESRRELRKGDGLSCLLFTIALEGVMRRAGLNSRGTIFTKSGQFVCFADDMDIIARTFGTVAELYTRLKREAVKVGLVMNASKTKYMLVDGTEHDRIRLGSNVTIDGDTFEVVEEIVYLGSLLTADNNVSREIRRRIISGSRTYYGLQKDLRSKKIHPRTKCTMYKTLIRPVVEEFVYLGSLLTADNNVSCEIRRRIISGSRAYYGLQKKLRSKKIHPRTKCTMYKTLIRPVILYGHETWTMLEEDLQALGVFERRVLRTIFGGVQENGVWRRRMNHELAALYGEPSIQKVAKAGRIRWAGHVARMPDNNPAKLVFATDPVGTRRRGAQRARWADQVERDLASIGRDRGWRAAATNRVLWRTIVDYVLS
ncbi:uncharacterized protein LOC134287678 [Aedes albopictus]|uniref:Reverse transcriptase domain-containing protein n=1 Tax=Aedes albopictus TaxID=7160 RepID=A0ABM1ZJ61_AEDAL